MRVLYLNGGEEEKKAVEQASKSVKSTFKIEINEEEKKIRDRQQTTVYHTGTKGLVEIDEEDRKEIEREALAEIDEDGGEDEDDEEDDPDEDLNF